MEEELTPKRIEAFEEVLLLLKSQEITDIADHLGEPEKLQNRCETIGVYNSHSLIVGNFRTYHRSRIQFETYDLMGSPPPGWMNEMASYCRSREQLAGRYLNWCLKGKLHLVGDYDERVVEIKDRYSEVRSWNYTARRQNGQLFIRAIAPGAPGTIEKNF
ncbi:MAG: hypothetical protein ACSHXD_20610 [Marinosulfonomonas sp.]